MLKYGKFINEKTKQCEVGLGTNTEFYKSIGMTEIEVEQAYNGDWYLAGYAPEKPAPTKDEVEAARRMLYVRHVDPITAHINRLKDEEQTEEVIAEIEALKAERSAIVEKIKSENPYPEESEQVDEQVEELEKEEEAS